MLFYARRAPMLLMFTIFFADVYGAFMFYVYVAMFDARLFYCCAPRAA